MEIKKATEDDLEWLIDELKKFDEFHDTKKSLFAGNGYWHEGLKKIVDKHIAYIAWTDQGERVGLIAGLASPHFFNPDVSTLTELFWWVSKEHRHSRAGLLLLNKFVEVGKQVADWVIVPLESNSPVNEKCLTKRGFNLKETSFVLEV